MPSQQEEDRIIDKYFGGSSEGSYIDIGAGDPVKLSNTYALYQKGWRGLVIEPYPATHERWYLIRGKDKLLPIAITDYEGDAKMAYTATVGSWVGDEYEERGEKTYKVQCTTIIRLLNKYPEFKEAKFVSIDVESNEGKILSVWNFDIFKPEIICIERQLRNIDRTHEWDKYLLPYYIKDKETYTNAFYKRL